MRLSISIGEEPDKLYRSRRILMIMYFLKVILIPMMERLVDFFRLNTEKFGFVLNLHVCYCKR